MRLHIKISKTSQIIDFNYQPLLTGCVHKWLGKDNLQHGEVSLYSFSCLQNVDVVKKGIQLTDNSYFILSFHDVDLTKIVVKNIVDDPEMFFGAKVCNIYIEQPPCFAEKERFLLASPVLIKRYEGHKETHYTFYDERSDELLTETLKTKAQIVGLNTDSLKVYFDKSYHSPKTKVISYKGIKNRANVCPVIIEGSPEIISFAWHVGLGNCTGIGFGALK
ncbi:CRISPR-associated endoribonuclease Cas6 [Porphyromonas pogonae]|uniref:CRISPR-associated endoribonuclease Cas6 n=1 Tax=Porphyromonas pogonae TaxID=867595 RepID=UPI002E77DAC1|nr:CRISPR-associated endoribonuclease Cas6 [Porphyromonas pogonae]